VSNPGEAIAWFQPQMTGGELPRLADVLERNFLNDGPLTREFEARIAQRAGVGHGIAVTSGTAAITLTLLALGIKPGNEVIVPDLTFIATANAARLAGATVVLADVEPLRLTLSALAVEAAITSRTRAIIPVDVNGRGSDYAALDRICRDRGLAMVCDAAEALGSRYDGEPLGSYGDAACFSFSPNKTLTTGQGGMIVTRSSQLADRLYELKDQGRRVRGSGGDDLHPVMGFNFKFTDLQAAVGLAQLDAFDARLAHAARRDAWYRAALAGVDGIVFPDMDSQAGEVRQWTDVLIDRRAEVRTALEAERIGCRSFWFPLHSQAPYQQAVPRFPNASRISDRGLWLPSNFDLSESDVARVASVIKTALLASSACTA
jgi:perosamine synthetase